MEKDKAYVTFRDKNYILNVELIDSITKCVIENIESYGVAPFGDMLQNTINRICKQYYNEKEYDIIKTATLESILYTELKLIIYSELCVCIKNGLNEYAQNIESKKSPTANARNDFNSDMLGMMPTIMKKDLYLICFKVWGGIWGDYFEIGICDVEQLPVLEIVVEFWEINKFLNNEGIKPIELL